MNTYIYKIFWLFFAIFLLSCHQATILAYSDFGREAISANLEQLSGVYIPKSLVLSYIKQLDLIKIISKIAHYAILMFFVQSVPAFIYACFNSARNKCKAALGIWLLPLLFGLPAPSVAIIYLMSPLFAIFTFPGFIFITGQTHKEDFAEGLIFMFAVIGWFNIFWLAVTIKAWFFALNQFDETD